MSFMLIVLYAIRPSWLSRTHNAFIHKYLYSPYSTHNTLFRCQADASPDSRYQFDLRVCDFLILTTK